MITLPRTRSQFAARRARVTRATFAVSAWLLACAPAAEPPGEWRTLLPGTDAEARRVTATVDFLDLEGGVWVLADNGTNYNPRNLPDDLRRQGASVEADVVVLDDVASIAMVGPVVDIVRIRAREAEPSAPPESPLAESGGVDEQADAKLAGTAWVLTEIGGEPVVGDAAATLNFPDGEQVAGHASCNRFTGAVRIDGSRVSIGPLALTRMACGSPLDEQEVAYTSGLETATRFEVTGGQLSLYADGAPLLRFRASAD